MKTEGAGHGNRFLWADGIRAVAIYLVILAHTISLPNHFTNLDLVAFSIYGFFSLLSVPLFVILSGSLLLQKNEGNVSFFKKRIMRVLLPWVFWSLIYVLSKVIMHEVADLSLVNLGHLSFQVFMSQFWFLPMIFGLYFLTPILRLFLRKANKSDVEYSILLWFIFIVIVPILLGRYYLIDSYVIQFVGYFILGYYIVKYSIERRVKKFFLPIFIGIFLISPIYYLIFTPLNPTGPSDLFSHISLFVVIASNLLFVVLSDFFQKNGMRFSNSTQRIITYLGEMSLGIYLSHILFINLYNFINPSFINNLPRIISIPIISFLVFGFSAATIFLLRRIPALRVIVG